MDSEVCGYPTYLLPLFQLVEVVHSEIADTNRPHFAFLDSLNQRLPRSQSTFRSLIGRVEQIQVDVLQFGLLQTLVDTPLRVLVIDALGRNLGSIKELFSWDTSAEQALGCGLLVSIHMRRVNMAVARFDGVTHDIFGYICRASDCVNTSSSAGDTQVASLYSCTVHPVCDDPA